MGRWRILYLNQPDDIGFIEQGNKEGASMAHIYHKWSYSSIQRWTLNVGRWTLITSTKPSTASKALHSPFDVQCSMFTTNILIPYFPYY